MKPLALCLILLAGISFAHAGAGPAFGVFSAVASQPYGKRAAVVEIRGERGQPQPTEWIVVLNDPTARGGIREITVANGRVTSERTPLQGMAAYADKLPLERKALAADSDRVFAAAQQQAVNNEVGFHWIAYRLETDPQSRAPVWNVRLFDDLGASLGTLRISAQTAAVVSPFEPDPAAQPVAGPEPKKKDSAGKKASDSVLRFMGSVQEAFTGERTVGPKDE